MIGLKKVTYINTGRFIFGEVDVSGNTLVTGTNGAGKTTTMQSILFFYGSNKRERLGIERGEGKDNWLKYTYPYLNSYVFYEYSGVNGNTLLMTYAAGNQIAYRFISMESSVDLKSIVLNADNTVKEKENILSEFIALGYKPSSQVASPQKYRDILYGAINMRVDKTLKEFADYALIKAEGNYNLIHEVQSSVFLSSRVETGTIEKAIAESFGNDVKIDIAQIREQLQDVMNDYSALKIYSSEKKLLADIFENHSKYISTEKKLISVLKQIIANYNFNQASLPELSKKVIDAKEAYEECLEENINKRTSLQADRDEAKSNYEHAKRELQRAEKLKEKYKDFDMDKLSALVDNIPMLELQKENASSNYHTLIGEQKSIAATYDEQSTQATTLYTSQKQEIINANIEQRKTFTIEARKKEDEYHSSINAVENEYVEILKESEKEVEDASETKNKINTELVLLSSKNPFMDEADKTKQQINSVTSELKEKESEHKRKRESILSILAQRESIEERIKDADTEAQSRYELMKQPYETEIARFVKLLKVNEDTLIYFIRENMSEHEDIITSLLKDEVLYDTTLSPSFSEDNNSIYGLNINTQNIKSSEYSYGHITAEINRCKEAIVEIKTQIDDELEERKKEFKTTLAKLQKDHFFNNKDVDELSNEILKLESNIISLKELLKEQVSLAQSNWEKEIEKVSTEHKDAIDNYKRLKKRKEDIAAEKSSKLTQLREDYKKYNEEVRNSLKLIDETEKEKLTELDRALKESKAKIEKNKNQALIDGGISSKELHDAENLLKKSKEELEKAKSYSNKVAIWRDDKKFFEQIPSLLKSCEESKILFDTAEKLLTAQNKEMKEREKELEEKMNALVQKQRNIQSQIEKTSSELEDGEFAPYLKKYNIKDIFEEVSLENVYAEFNKAGIFIKNLTEYYFAVEKNLERFKSKIGDEKYIWFTYKNSTTSEVLASVDSLKLFMEGGGIIETKELVAKSIRGIQSNIIQRYGNLNIQSDNIKSNVNKISKSLSKAVRDIAVLDDIGLRYVKSDNKILSELKAISEVDIPYGDLNSLFSDSKKSEQSTQIILERFEELLTSLETEKAEYITVSDTFEVELKAVENGNSTNWIKARKRIGSEGTSVIVKTLLYIAMLDTVLTMTRKNVEANIHVLLDEIGKIDQKNMREIIKFANNAGILLFNAAPDSKVPSMYNCIYHYRIIRGKSKITLAAVRR